MSVRNRVDGGTERFREEALRGLGANQEVMLITDHLRTMERLGKHLPFPAYPCPMPPGSETLLFLPLFLEQQCVGVLVVIKASSEGEYTPSARLSCSRRRCPASTADDQ